MAKYVLEIVEGPETGRQLDLSEPLDIGRDPNAGFVLDSDELVSRLHAHLEPAEDGVRVEDLGSSNGTFVNGDEIHGPAHLSPGSQLLVGVTLLELRTPEQVAVRPTTVQAVPVGLTTLRPAATTPEAQGTTLRKTPASLARPEATPDYVPAEILPPEHQRGAVLHPLLDTHTKSKARTAPLAVFVLVALVVLVYFATR